jgi:hypothetical protein
MNFKEYVIFKEAKKNSTKGKKKPEVEEKDVSIDDLKSQLPEVEEKDVSIDDLKSQLPEVEEKDVSIDDLKSQLDDLLLKIQRPSNTYEFILDSNVFDVLHVPAGYLTAIQSLERNAKLLVMADYKKGELNDELRFPFESNFSIKS